MAQKKIQQNQLDPSIEFTDPNAVTGPATATDNAIARFDGTTGKLVQNSGATVDDTGQLSADTVSASDWMFTPYLSADEIASTISTAPTFPYGLKADTISEKTAAAGVTIDGVKLKDGALYDSAANKALEITAASASRNSYAFAQAGNGSAKLGAWSDTVSDADLRLDAKGTGKVRAWDGLLYLEVANVDGTQTLTNKRITSRRLASSPAGGGTVTADSNSYDLVDITPTGNFTIATPTGSPTEGQKLLIRIRDNGTARTITWQVGTWRALGVTLPTTTMVNKTMYIGAVYNGNGVWWDVIAVSQET